MKVTGLQGILGILIGEILLMSLLTILPNVYYLATLALLMGFLYYIYNKYGFYNMLITIEVIGLITCYVCYQGVLSTFVISIGAYMPAMVFTMCAVQILTGVLLSKITVNQSGIFIIIFGVLNYLFIMFPDLRFILSFVIGIFSSVPMLLSGKILASTFDEMALLFGYVLYFAFKLSSVARLVLSSNKIYILIANVLVGTCILFFNKTSQEPLNETNNQDMSENQQDDSVIKNVFSMQFILMAIFSCFASSFFYLLNVTTINYLITNSKIMSPISLTIFEQGAAFGVFIVPIIASFIGIINSQVFFSISNLLTAIAVGVFCTNNSIVNSLYGILGGKVLFILSSIAIWLSGIIASPHMLPQIYVSENLSKKNLSVYTAIHNVCAMVVGNFGAKVLENIFLDKIGIHRLIMLFVVINIIPFLVSIVIKMLPDNKQKS